MRRAEIHTARTCARALKARSRRRHNFPGRIALAEYLNLSLPPWIPASKGKDNWQTTAWGRSTGLVEKEAAAIGVEDHF